ncbi:hypothetical protein NCS55_00854200 [Fusarium keratoplasticum]|nr:hypothetical protein NCS55_00854200 [Fusarium keratoplasticum]
MGFITSYGSMQTPAPSLDDLHRREDKKMTVTRAPDEICGFISERPGATFGCSLGDYCYFFPPASQQTPQHNRVVCCGEGECQWFSTCYNFEEYYTSRKCTDGCEVDNYILKCTGTDLPYCNTVSWEGNTVDYACNDVDITTTMSAALTYKGQKNSRKFFTMNDEQVSALFQGLDGPASTTEGSDSTATKGSAPAATEAKDSDGGSGTNTGAIVGGVVGGVGAIALFAVAILLFLRMRKKKKAQDVSPPEYEATPRDDNNNKEALQPGQQAGAPYSDTLPNAAPAIHEAEVKDKPQELADNAPKKEPVELA